MADLLRELRIELVLTAHPTEAKRRTVLSKLQRISDLLRHLQDADLLPRERMELLAGLQAEITALWLTDRARTTRPAVTDEVRTGLYFVDEVFWDLVPRIDADLEAAVSRHYPGLAPPPAWLTVASWIGGDRDGNPSVVTELTAETLRLHRGLAVERHRRSVQDLARRLSVSGRRCPPPEALTAWLDARRPLPAHVAYLEQRYAGEPYRLALSLLAADLEAASREDMRARLLDEAPHAARISAAEVRKVVDLVARASRPRSPATGSARSSISSRPSACTRPASTSGKTPRASPPRSATSWPASASRPASPSATSRPAPRCSSGSSPIKRPRPRRSPRSRSTSCRPRRGACSASWPAPRPSTAGRRSGPSSSR